MQDFRLWIISYPFLGCVLFWDFMQHKMVVSYWCFGTTNQSRLRGQAVQGDCLTLKLGPTRCPDTLVRNYHSVLFENLEECRTYLHCGGSLKASFVFCSFARSNATWLVFCTEVWKTTHTRTIHTQEKLKSGTQCWHFIDKNFSFKNLLIRWQKSSRSFPAPILKQVVLCNTHCWCWLYEQVLLSARDSM